jgi:CBS-domain-containing membrane protein
MKRVVEDVMTRTVVVVREQAPFKEVVRLMDEYRVSALPVVDATARLVGIVSEGDLLLKEGQASEDGVDDRHVLPSRRRRTERAKSEATVAADLMTSPVVTVAARTSLPDAARLMHRHAIKRLPVVSSDGFLEGIVSRADLLKVFLRTDEEIRREVAEDVVQRTMWIEPDTVRVQVADGVVQLQGELEQKSLVPVLADMVRRVEGVVDVQNQLTFDVDDTDLRKALVPRWGGYESGHL